ncbi:MAG TPA: hypothetical protein VN040_19930 [Pseudosphingobacterium sp.]|nr:hypothetical protein [Pseudosphingobacterium sp.]
MKRTLVIIAVFLFTIACFTGCQKDDDTTGVSHLYGIYAIREAKSNAPVDLNFDDKETEDIMKELPSIKNSFLTIKENIVEKGVFADQGWPIPENNEQGLTAPPNYLQSFNIGYCKINQNKAQLIFEWQKTIDSRRESEQTANFSNEETIQMNYETSVFTKNGWKDITVHLVYKRFNAVI